MSIEKRTLDEYHDKEENDEKAADSERTVEEVDGAAYGRPETYRAQEPEDAGCCRSCGTPVAQVATRPPEIKRVWADEHGRVLAGPCCQDPQTFSKAIQGVKGTTERARELSVVEAHRREGADL
jgi:hypothetical protein